MDSLLLEIKQDGDRLLFKSQDETEWKEFDSKKFFQTEENDFTVASLRSLTNRPTDEELQLINDKFVPIGFDPLSVDEVVMINGIAADNLVNRSYSRWGVPELRKMADLLVGKVGLFDHDSYDAQYKSWGRVVSARVVKSTPTDEQLDKIALGEFNRAIVEKEGFYQVYFRAFTLADHPAIDGIRSGVLKGLSTGGFSFTDFECPVCDTSIRNPKCPHYIRSPWSSIDSDEVAPYVTRRGLTDLLEISIVSCANIPLAELI